MASPAVEPLAVAFEEQAAATSGSRTSYRAVVALLVAVQAGWIMALTYTFYVYVI